MKEKASSGWYYNSEEYKEKLAEVEAQKQLYMIAKQEEAEQKLKEQKKERNKLLKIFTKERCGEDNMHMVRALVDRVAFLKVELDHIEQQLSKEGTMDFFVQGTQTMWREHPLSKVHSQHSKSYREVIKQLESYAKADSGDTTGAKNELVPLIGRGNAAREKYKK